VRGVGRDEIDDPVRSASLVYLPLWQILQMFAQLARNGGAKDVELLVLRHEVAARPRQVHRPDLQPADRVVPATLSRLLPRPRRSAFLVTPGDTPAVAPPTDRPPPDLSTHPTRHVHVVGITAHPTGTWVAQQTRKLPMTPDEHTDRSRSRSATPGHEVHAERWMGTARRERTDPILILGQRHLTAVIGEYPRHHNDHRPHRALAQQPPNPTRATPNQPAVKIQRRPILNGPINEYAQAAQDQPAFGAPQDAVAHPTWRTTTVEGIDITPPTVVA
jgi:hypothetical protein